VEHPSFRYPAFGRDSTPPVLQFAGLNLNFQTKTRSVIVKKIIALIATAVAAIAMVFVAVYTYRKGVAAVKSDLAARWARAKTILVAWFHTSKPETT
jgi:hypothetical protein